MSAKIFSIQKLGGGLDEALLRFSVPLPGMGVIDCYLGNDQLANLAHILSKFLHSPDSARTSYTFGSFEETDAGGALKVALSRDGALLHASFDIIDEESKGVENPRILRAQVSAHDIARFANALNRLHHAESGVAQLHLRQA